MCVLFTYLDVCADGVLEVFEEVDVGLVHLRVRDEAKADHLHTQGTHSLKSVAGPLTGPGFTSIYGLYLYIAPLPPPPFHYGYCVPYLLEVVGLGADDLEGVGAQVVGDGIDDVIDAQEGRRDLVPIELDADDPGAARRLLALLHHFGDVPQLDQLLVLRHLGGGGERGGGRGEASAIWFEWEYSPVGNDRLRR